MNGSNIRCRTAGSMPMPVSRTSKRTLPSTADTVTLISPCCVNLIEFPTRLTRICRSRTGSPQTESGQLGCTKYESARFFDAASAATDLIVSAMRPRSGKYTGSSSSLRASMRAKSSTSSIMAISVSADRLAVSSRRTVASGGSSSMASSNMPTTPCRGVRISWDMFVTNSLFAALASSARAWASSSRRMRSRDMRTYSVSLARRVSAVRATSAM